MTNRDMPAHPGTQRAWPKDGPIDGVLIATDGLTKREAAAIAAMQGLLAASGGSEHYYAADDIKNVSRAAVDHADALFDDMEKLDDD